LKVAIGVDHAGLKVKGRITKYLQTELEVPNKNEQIKDAGSDLSPNVKNSLALYPFIDKMILSMG